MTTEIVKPQKMILMKSGLPLFMDAERVRVLEDILAAGSSHRFINIDDRTINSAEIEGIYAPDQYDELQRVKRGEYKCQYRKWHGKREECHCEKEVREKLETYERLKKRLDTPDELKGFDREAIQKYFDELCQWLKKRNIIPE